MPNVRCSSRRDGMTHVGEIIAGLAFGILTAVAIIPHPRPKPPEIVTMQEKNDARQSDVPAPELPDESQKPPPVVYPQLLQQQQQARIENLEERVEHIDAQVKRIDRKLEAPDGRAP